MIDQYGHWTYTHNIPAEKKCDLDLVADWITEQGYAPETSMENLTFMIVSYYDLELYDVMQSEYYAIAENPYAPMINVDDVAVFVSDNGGLREFDFEA